MSRQAARGLEILAKGIGIAIFMVAFMGLFLTSEIDLFIYGLMLSMGLAALVVSEIFSQLADESTEL